jgi:hypothetical protein
MGADRILAVDCHEARLAVAREQGATDGGLVDILPPDVRGPSWACLGSDRSKADAIKISTLILMAWSSRAFVAGHVRAGRVEEARVRRFILAVKSALATRHREVTKSLSQRKVTRPLWSTPGAGDRGQHSGRVPVDHPNGPVDCLYGGAATNPTRSAVRCGAVWPDPQGEPVTIREKVGTCTRSGGTERQLRLRFDASGHGFAPESGICKNR